MCCSNFNCALMCKVINDTSQECDKAPTDIKHNFKSVYSDIFSTVRKDCDSDIVAHCYGSILYSEFEIKHEQLG